MKLFKCPFCGRERRSKEDVVVSVCPVCIVESKEVIGGEIKEDGQGNK